MSAERSNMEEAVVSDETLVDHDLPRGLKLITIMLALCMTVFCVALDNTIIATAIPRISDNFHALGDVGWYGSAYLLTTCSFQLFYGKLYTHLNKKWTFLIALFIFELGSLICGVAPSSVAFIVGRAIAGLGAAGLLNGSMIIVAEKVTIQQRPTFTGIIGGMYGIASVAGPLLGGAFTEYVTWRWCFYINLPLGGAAAVIVLFFLTVKPRKPNEKDNMTLMDRIWQFDIIGSFLFVPSMICLLLAVQWGGTTYPWSDGRVIALFVVFGVLLIGFVAVQIWNGSDATVPPRIAKQRSMAFGSIFSFCIGAAFFIFIYYIPIWFQAIKNTSTTQSGIDSLPLILAQALGTVIAGILTTRLGYYMPWVMLSVVFLSVGAGLITTFHVDTPSRTWIGYQIIFGLGSGFGFQQMTIAAQTILPTADVPTGTAVVMFVQLLGGSIFVTVAENLFTNRLLSGIVQQVPNLNPSTISSAGATGLRDVVPSQYLAQVLVVYNEALVKTFQVALIMSCLTLLGAVGVEWRSVKGIELTPMAA